MTSFSTFGSTQGPDKGSTSPASQRNPQGASPGTQRNPQEHRLRAMVLRQEHRLRANGIAKSKQSLQDLWPDDVGLLALRKMWLNGAALRTTTQLLDQIARRSSAVRFRRIRQQTSKKLQTWARKRQCTWAL